MKIKTRDYKAGLMKRLKDPEYAADYLAEVLEHESQQAFLIAVKNVIDSRKSNITKLSKKVGITRQGVYNALSKQGNPRLSTLNQILKTVGIKISFDADIPEKKAA